MDMPQKRLSMPWKNKNPVIDGGIDRLV